jgi:hypothetical protein
VLEVQSSSLSLAELRFAVVNLELSLGGWPEDVRGRRGKGREQRG